ncbi:MAG: ShlB/FhaC/HecB family hemolysin secretion/activation protein [Endomicrobium sp.]|jgi:hemolysin activation/secretion protein|nr:ShlB/FhaC/HecB family hemolysin secretion/activation protein [Endomicrobium sp.]
MKIKTIITLVILSAVNINLFGAQSPDEIQRNIDAYYQDRLRQFEIQNRTSISKEKETPQSPPEQKLSSVKKLFKEIIVKHSGVRGISWRKINKLTAKYKNIPMSYDDITALQNEIQQIFLAAGYSSARVYIDSEAFSRDILEYPVFEGNIEKLAFKRKSGRKYGRLAQALQSFSFYPFAKDSLLNIKDLDQGIEQMNRLSTGNAVLTIVPGDKDGYSVVEITNNAKNRFIISLGADNSGAQSNGLYRGNSSISADNLLMLNDNISFSYSRNIDGIDKDKSSNNYFASFSIPFGYFTFMASSFYSDYSVPAGLSVGDYTTDGATKNSNISLETIIKRSDGYKISAGAEGSLKETVNNVAGEKVDVSSRKLSIASVFLTHTQSLNGGNVYSKVSYNRGLDCFDAVKNTPESLNSPKGQFYSVSLYAQYMQYFKVPFTSFTLNYSLALNAQYSPDILYSSEQTAIGGQSSVRGFKEGSVSGDSGAYVKNTLSFNLSEIFKRNGFFNLLSATKISAFFDSGYARHAAYGKDYQLSGGGAGVSYNSKYFNVNGVWSRAILNRSDLAYEGNVFYFNIEGKIYF